MGCEYELKFKGTPEVLREILSDLSGDIRHFDMQTTYYDTPGRELSARHWTLRRRLENQTSVCTLKTPGIHGLRGEFEVDCPDIQAAVPVLCKLSGKRELEALAASGLQEVCGARFHRIAVTVTLPDAVAEVALDQGVLIGSGRELPLCEVEVEWKDGSQAAVEAYGTQLAQRFHLETESQSKFRRAVILAGGI